MQGTRWSIALHKVWVQLPYVLVMETIILIVQFTTKTYSYMPCSQVSGEQDTCVINYLCKPTYAAELLTGCR